MLNTCDVNSISIVLNEFFSPFHNVISKLMRYALMLLSKIVTYMLKLNSANLPLCPFLFIIDNTVQH